MFIIVYLKIHIFFLIYYFQLTCILRLACFSLVPRTGKMVSTNRRRANASSSTTPHLSLSQVGELVPQGSLSPSQPDVNIPQTPSSGADSNTQKSVRGPTRGIALRKLNKKNKDKLIIHIDPVQRRPIDSVESAKLSSELGQIARESLPVPNKWKNFKKTELMAAFTQLDMNLKIDNPTEENIEDVMVILKNRCRTQRHKLNKHFKKFCSVEEAIRNKPSFGGLTQKHWETLCTTLFNDPKYQERCNINKQNRSKMTTNHNQGSRSFVVARHMLSQEPEFEGDEVDRIKFHKHTHYTEGKGWITPQSENNHVEMEKRRIDAETRGEVVDVDKIVDDTLGKRLSYIVGLGYGPKPNKSSSGMRILQETLKEKDRECAELREERVALMEEMNAMKSTLAEHTRLFEKLVQSQNLSSPW
ncbi:hypothetical protein BUALT_Bualt08G0012400 [Buddleja alternifolia]|uniref:Transposase, Ptta/En/Spm, plant n=1 Tax=Buddleja alternifolia TaxID=168488 RepID=A0AAV6XDL8_9LAMI|nr:hypothetical protein BUALT_Bualt08G0012400 [Buddleja alternifolia]